jgi:alkylation response protein AidB-like acyl-CoA dehydrogenase
MKRSSPPTPRSASAIGAAALESVARAGLLHVSVPAALGGDGAPLIQLATAARMLAASDPTAAWIFRAQRLAIELLVQADNVGLCEHLLPQLLTGERGGTLSLASSPRPLLVQKAGNAMRLYGQYPRVPNLQRAGFSVAVPVQIGRSAEWVMLRGEEDGLHVGIDQGDPCPLGSRTATLRFDGVFFRMDELLGEASVWERVAPVARALAEAVPVPEP